MPNLSLTVKTLLATCEIMLRLTKQSFEIKFNAQEKRNAEVAELADALRSGRSELTLMRVQVPPSAQKKLAAERVFFVISRRIFSRSINLELERHSLPKAGSLTGFAR